MKSKKGKIMSTRLIKDEKIKENATALLESAISCMLEPNIISVSTLIAKFSGSISTVRDAILWENFKTFIENLEENAENTKIINKLSGKLAEMGDSHENAKRIIKCIDEVGTKHKAIYLSNLTRALCADNINSNLYFKLCNCIIRLTEEDLVFLDKDISRRKEKLIYSEEIEKDSVYIDFKNEGLLLEADDGEGGLGYTKKAIDVCNYAINYGKIEKQLHFKAHEIQINGELTEKDILNIVKEENPI